MSVRTHLAVLVAIAAASMTACSGDNGEEEATPPAPTATVTVTAEPTPVPEPELELDAVTEASWEFDPAAYSHGDVLAILYESGFKGYVENAENPNSPVKDTCWKLDNEVPGSAVPRSDRAAWMQALTGTDDGDWGWTPERAKVFVDTLFAACYDTGRSTAAKPPPPSFGDGTWRVGTDIQVGTYRVASADGYCLWYRLNKMSSGIDPDAIITWGWTDEGQPILATIEPGDVAFQSIGCGTWRKIG